MELIKVLTSLFQQSFKFLDNLATGMIKAVQKPTYKVEVQNHPEFSMPKLPEFPKIPDFPDEIKVQIKGVDIVTIKGEHGDKGDKGDDGKQGIQGEKGNTGKTGENGPKGDKGEKGKQGEFGKDGLEGRDGIDGKDGSPDKPEDVRDKLETLKGNSRLDAKAIKNLPEATRHIVGTLGGGGGYALTVQDEGAKIEQFVKELNFTGAGVSAARSGDGKVDVTVAGFIIGDGVSKITVSSSTPSSPTIGDLWIDTT